MQNRIWQLSLVLLISTAGCASRKKAAHLAFTGDPFVDGRNAVANGPPRDRVLWQYRTAAVAMRRQEYGAAKTFLDEALARIGGIAAHDKEAKKARGYFHREEKKTFIGEPYERVMAYYYRGILYWMDGELDNARACFKSAQLQDGDTQEKTYSSDYVLLDYLDGYTTTKLGGDGSDEFKRAQSLANKSKPPPYHRRANVVVFLEFGRGPVKYATGQYGEELRFRDPGSSARSVSLKLGQQQFALVPYDDLHFQATTRGGRVMDHILANKAVFKTGTSVAGDAAIISSLALAHHREGEAALAVGAVGLISKILSASTTPDADTRSWDNLPRYISFAALQLPPGQHTLSADFRDAAGRVLLTKTATFNVSVEGKDIVLFLSELNS